MWPIEGLAPKVGDLPWDNLPSGTPLGRTGGHWGLYPRRLCSISIQLAKLRMRRWSGRQEWEVGSHSERLLTGGVYLRRYRATLPDPSGAVSAAATPCLTPATVAEPALNERRAFLGGVHHPWRRFFARWVDTVAIGVPAGFAIGVGIGLLSHYLPALSILLRDHPLLWTVIGLAAWAPIEALLVSATGTTPGKWLFGIRILDAESNARLSLGGAFKRTILALAQGCGAALPVLSLITALCAYQRLTRTGTTLWDASTEAKVTHTKWTPVRATACVLAVMGVLVVLVGLQLIANSQ